MTEVELWRPTVEEACEAVKAAAWLVSDEDSPDYGRRLVHCRMSFTGADWDMHDVLKEIRNAQDMAWNPGSFLGHDLDVLGHDGSLYHFDVSAPEQRP